MRIPRSEYLTYWARDARGRYIGTAPEGEGAARLGPSLRRDQEHGPAPAVTRKQEMDDVVAGLRDSRRRETSFREMLKPGNLINQALAGIGSGGIGPAGQ